MSTSPEAKQAAIDKGYQEGSVGHPIFCRGYDSRNEEVAKLQRQLENALKVATFQELREENAELREERDDMERQAQAAFKVFQREAAKLREVLSRWKRDLAYLDSIKLTEAGDSSRYQLNKCIEDLEKQLAHQQPSAGRCDSCGEPCNERECCFCFDKRQKSEQPRAPTPEDCNMILGALDSLGVALANHNHEWTEGERAIYEAAVEFVERVKHEK